MRLYDLLKDYEYSDYYGFHMPGHKRNKKIVDAKLPYGIDITEIEGFDDLHHAEGILKEAQERAARIYKAEETHFLVNGSTVGILSAILGVTRRGDKVLVARNCHKSVYNALELNELQATYVYPSFDVATGLNDVISPECIEQTLQQEPDIKAVIIVSPTYDGVVSDVKRIAEIVHERGLPLIVDEAHGAHFGFHSYFPENANVCGADIVIHSVHKTLPSLTQTALLHMNGEIANRARVRKYLHMLQSSSPSYILMASIDACVDFLERSGEVAFQEYTKRLQKVRKELEALKHLQLVETLTYDKSKLVISVQDTNISSKELFRRLLEDYHLQPEMAAGNYVLFMSSVCDTEEGFARLLEALCEIDNQLSRQVGSFAWRQLPRPKKEEAGEVATDYIYLYPPGSPIVCPGEVMTEEIREYLKMYRAVGFTIIGDEDE